MIETINCKNLFLAFILSRSWGLLYVEPAHNQDHAIDVSRLAISSPHFEQAVCDVGRYVSAELREQQLLVVVSECALTGRLPQFCGDLAPQVPAEGGSRKEQLYLVSRQYQCSNHA